MLSAGPEVSEYVRLSRELAELDPVAAKARELTAAENDLKEAESLLNDPATDREMRALAEDERRLLKERIETLSAELSLLLVPRDEADDRSAILEVRAGTGGDEAALFAGDLFRMYERYAALYGWKVELLSASAGEVGGYREIVAAVRGRGVYARLKFEIGGASRAAGAGDGGERTHPHIGGDGRRASGGRGDRCLDQAGRSAHRHHARVKLRRAARQHNRFRSPHPAHPDRDHRYGKREVAASESRARDGGAAGAALRHGAHAQSRRAGGGAQGASRIRRPIGKIRTYNFPQGRVTDHRINLTLYKLPKVLEGEALDEIIQPLIADDQARRLAEFEGGSA